MKSSFDGAVLMIGSLYWDKDLKRVNWRQSDMNIEHKQYVTAPIRYGRISGSGRKNTHTMVFSSLCYQEGLGTAVLVPLKEPVSNASELLSKAANLWHAEKSASQVESLEISSGWGAVGLLVNPECNLPEEFIDEWKQHYRNQNSKPRIQLAAGETPIITADGILQLSWPTDIDIGNFVDLDFILATAIEPNPNDGEYPSAQKIAEIYKENKYTEYFDNNRANGITTFQDEEIEKYLESL